MSTLQFAAVISVTLICMIFGAFVFEAPFFSVCSGAAVIVVAMLFGKPSTKSTSD